MVEKVFISFFVSLLIIAFSWWNLFCIILHKYSNKAFYSILFSCLFTFLTLLFIRIFDLYLIANYKWSVPALILLSGASYGFNNYKSYSNSISKILHGTVVISAISLVLFYGLTTLFKIAT